MAQIHVTEKHTKKPARQGGQHPPHQAGTRPYAGYSNQIITAAKHRRHYRPYDDRPLKITGPQHAQSERAGPQPAASTKPDQQQPAHPNGYPSPREPGHPTHPTK